VTPRAPGDGRNAMGWARASGDLRPIAPLPACRWYRFWRQLAQNRCLLQGPGGGGGEAFSSHFRAQSGQTRTHLGMHPFTWACRGRSLLPAAGAL